MGKGYVYDHRKLIDLIEVGKIGRNETKTREVVKCKVSFASIAEVAVVRQTYTPSRQRWIRYDRVVYVVFSTLPPPLSHHQILDRHQTRKTRSYTRLCHSL